MKIMNDFFNPKSVAIVGVSKDDTKIGTVIYKNLIKADYKGDIYIVNPKYDSLYGRKCYKSLTDVAKPIQTVCIAIPAQFVLETVKECASIDVQNIVVISAGFGERSKEGKELERDILKVCQDNKMQILGPNCLGFISTPCVNLSFAQGMPIKGNIAFMSQSGAVCTAILDRALTDNLGFSHFVSMGNKIDIDELTLLKSWLIDDNVKVIGGYIEEICCGKEIIDLYRQHVYTSSNPKPFVLIKPGRNEQSKKAIGLHTGAMAGDYISAKTALNQAGIIMAQSDKELYNALRSFAWSKKPLGDSIAVITNAGGVGIMAMDKLIDQGLKIASFGNETVQKLTKAMPGTLSENGIVDVLGDADALRYGQVCEIVADDANVDAVIVILTPQFVTQVSESAKEIVKCQSKSKIPIIPIFICSYSSEDIWKLFIENKIAAYDNLDDAITTLSNQLQFVHRSNLIKRGGLPTIISTSKEPSQQEIEKMLIESGVKIPRQIICEEFDDAAAFAHGKYPIVIKAPNEVIMHKTDKKAIFANIKSADELSVLFRKIKQLSPSVLVQEQISFKHEFFIGAVRDQFGGALLFGQGGIYTEIKADIARICIPATIDDIIIALEQTKIWKILHGVRGESKMNTEGILKAILGVQRIMMRYDKVVGIDLSPLLVSTDGLFAVDIKIVNN